MSTLRVSCGSYTFFEVFDLETVPSEQYWNKYCNALNIPYRTFLAARRLIAAFAVALGLSVQC